MKKNTNIWKDEEVYTLFKFVEKFKTNNQPLLKAFELFANEYKRKKNSVRNFYYLKLKEFEKNPILAQKLNINLIAHTKTEQKFFTIEETELSMNKINTLLKKGYSVRRACLEVAQGNIKEMLRLQNKYRSLKLKNKIHDCFIIIKNSRKQLFDNNSEFQQKTSNILQMPNRNNPVLTDEEIKSLFMGLVNLVKKSAIEQFDKKIYKQLQDANFELRKSIKNLVTKEQEYLLGTFTGLDVPLKNAFRFGQGVQDGGILGGIKDVTTMEQNINTDALYKSYEDLERLENLMQQYKQAGYEFSSINELKAANKNTAIDNVMAKLNKLNGVK